MSPVPLRIRTRATTLALAAALVPATAAAADVGTVQLAVGAVSLEQGGAARALRAGDAVAEGAVLVTGADGHLHLRMIDGAFVSVRPGSRLQLQTYGWDPADPGASRVRLVLERGVVRSITGRAGESARHGFRLNTPVAAVGIRGTDFTVLAEGALTRVAVQGGAVVVAPLDAGCRAEGLGPCATPASRALTAAMRDAYLELRSRGEAPVLVPAERALEAPNRVSPPRPEEPRAAATAAAPVASSASPAASGSPAVSGSSAASAPSASPAPSAGADSASTSPATPGAAPPAASPVAEVNAEGLRRALGSIEPPAPAPAPAPQIWWGRWSTYLRPGEESASVPAQPVPDRQVTTVNTWMGLMRSDPGIMSWPAGGGVASFRLAAGEAFLSPGAGAALVSARIESPQLTIDFDTRRFSTSLVVQAPGTDAVSIGSAGRITNTGYLVGATNADGTRINGAMSADASQAGYLFERPLGDGRTALGATRWVR